MLKFLEVFLVGILFTIIGIASLRFLGLTNIYLCFLVGIASGFTSCEICEL